MKVFKKSQVQEVADAIMNDNYAIIMPTDTVWAVVTNNETLVYAVKNRPLEKKVSLFIENLDHVALPSFYKQVLSKYMPGELSFVWKNTNYRIPQTPFVRKLLSITGPLYQSSANLSGQMPVKNIQEAMKVFAGSPHNVGVVEQDETDIMSGRSSTIINLDNLTIIRAGVVNGEQIIDEIKKGLNK